MSPQDRERAIEELSKRFANDELTLEELERRLERVYKVRSTSELEELIGPRPPSAVTATRYPVAPLTPRAPAVATGGERMVSIMSDTKRRGPWTAGQRLELLGIMSDTTIDLTQAVLPDHDMEIDLTAFMAAVKIIVPRGMPVISRVGAFMATVRNRSEAAAPSSYYPTLVVTGSAIMAEVKVIVRDRR